MDNFGAKTPAQKEWRKQRAMYIAIELRKNPLALQTINPNVQAAASREIATAWAELATDLDQKRRKITIDPQNFKRFIVTVIEGQIISAENRIDPTKR